MIENGNLKLEQSEGLNCGDGLNWYAYVGNDPVNLIDRFGLCPESDGSGSGTYYFGFTAGLTIPLLDAIVENSPTQFTSAFGVYYDSDDKTIGLYDVNSTGASVIPDAQLGVEFGKSKLRANDYFSRETATAEIAAVLISESVVVDNRTGDIIATEKGFSISALGRGVGLLLGKGSKLAKTADKFFNTDLAGRQDSSAFWEMIDFDD